MVIVSLMPRGCLRRLGFPNREPAFSRPATVSSRDPPCFLPSWEVGLLFPLERPFEAWCADFLPLDKPERPGGDDRGVLSPWPL
jgi:hypothetical protein